MGGGVREGGAIVTSLALQANGSTKNLMVCSSHLGIFFTLGAAPRLTQLRQALNHLSSQLADIQTERRGRHIIRLLSGYPRNLP